MHIHTSVRRLTKGSQSAAGALWIVRTKVHEVCMWDHAVVRRKRTLRRRGLSRKKAFEKPNSKRAIVPS